MRLQGQAIVVTGASRGLGAAIAARLARDGAHLLLAARDAAALQALAAGLDTAPGQRVVGQPCDVSSADDVARLFARADAEFGRLDVLVANAGVYGPMGPSEDVDWDAWVQAVQINLFGVVLCCREAVRRMRRRGGGKIVVLSGGGATQPLPRFSAYAASKAGVVRFAETLAEEAKDAGIMVNVVAPGALNTRMLDEALQAGPERVGEAFYARMLKQQAEGGTPLDVPAELVAWLASSASDGISGRLLSAVWDDWRGLPERREQLAASDVFTLRRIVPEDRGWDTK